MRKSGEYRTALRPRRTMVYRPQRTYRIRTLRLVDLHHCRWVNLSISYLHSAVMGRNFNNVAEELPMDTSRLPITDKAGLKQALEDANLPSLLMVYIQYTQDEPYLKEFEPYLRAIYSTDVATIPDDLAADLRNRLFNLLTDPNPPAEKKPSRELVRRMMSVSVGEEVDEQLIPVLYDQMGFEPPVIRKALPNRPQAPVGFKVLVIGAGMSGIAAGIKLDEAGYDYTILEKNSEVGGTWL